MFQYQSKKYSLLDLDISLLIKINNQFSSRLYIWVFFTQESPKIQRDLYIRPGCVAFQKLTLIYISSGTVTIDNKWSMFG